MSKQKTLIEKAQDTWSLKYKEQNLKDKKILLHAFFSYARHIFQALII